MVDQNPLSCLTLTHLNKEGVRLSRLGDKHGAVQHFNEIMDRVRRMHLLHPELHVCLCNRASALLALGQAEQALADAQQALAHIQQQIPGVPLRRHHYFSKVLLRQGQALIALGNHAGAQIIIEAGLNADPMSLDLRTAHECTVQQQQQQQQQRQALMTMHRQATQGQQERQHEYGAVTMPDAHGAGSGTGAADMRGLKGSAADSLKIKKQSQHQMIMGSSSDDPRVKELMQIMQASEPMMPLARQLPARRAEVEQYTRDTYNYLTTQADAAMPRRLLESFVHDEPHLKALEAAICQSVNDIHESLKDCRVLVLGSGMGIIPLLALKAGAIHVTIIERWLYVASACKDVLLHNGVDPASFSVIHARPEDVHLSKQIPVPCNLLIANGLLDDGLFTSGIVPSVSHCLKHLMLPEPTIIPAAATVYAQALEVNTPPVCGGLQLSALDTFRCQALPTAGAPLCSYHHKALAEPHVAFQFEFPCLPDESQIRPMPTAITQPGVLNAVAYWYDLRLYACEHYNSKTLSTAAASGSADSASLSAPAQRPASHNPANPQPWVQPAIQYLLGGAAVSAGDTAPLIASYNMYRLGFALEVENSSNGGLCQRDSSASYSMHNATLLRWSYLFSSEPSLPRKHFSAAADETKLQAYEAAIIRAITKKKSQGQQVHVLDLGCGCGSLALLAARAGADSVTGAEAHPALVAAARRNASLNGLSAKVSIVHGDCSNLEVGQHVPWDGANLLVMDLFDETLLGGGVLRMLRAAAKRGLVAKDADIVPAKASLYMMGLQVLSLTAGSSQIRRDAAETGSANTAYFSDGSAACASSAADLGRRSSTKDGEHAQQSSSKTGSINLAPCNKYRWEDAPQAVRLDRLPYTQLTPPIHLWNVDFRSVVVSGPLQGIVPAADADAAGAEQRAESGAAPDQADAAAAHASSCGAGADPGDAASKLHGIEDEARKQDEGTSGCAGGSLGDGLGGSAESGMVCASGSSAAVMASVPACTQGVLNSAVLWFTLHLDEHTSISTAPDTCVKEGMGMHTLGQQGQQNQQQASASTAERKQYLQNSKIEQDQPARQIQLGRPHYWGQGLLYLDFAMAVQPGQVVQLAAKREGPTKVAVTLRPGRGVKAPRPPWLEPWGGGVSIENPHVQRMEYCRLLESEYMQRLPMGKGHAVERDVQVVASHCGSLILDPHSLASCYTRLALMDRLYRGRSGYSSTEVQGVMGPSCSAHTHCPDMLSGSSAGGAAVLAPVALGMVTGAGLNNVSSPYLSEPVPNVAVESVLGSRALEWY